MNQPASPSTPRERLLATADRLFLERGIRAVGIDLILAESGVAKASLYRWFRSKDELVAEWLRGRDQAWFAWFEGEVGRVRDPAARLAAAFAFLGRWVTWPAFAGCAFVNTAIELRQLDHPAMAVVAAHSERLRAFFVSAAQEAGLARAARVGAALHLLFEGVLASAMGAAVERRVSEARVAKEAAAALVASARR
jgi:AcrR family transcriptional regulator